MNQVRRRILVIITLLLILTQVSAAAQVQVDFLDVGQGDCILIRSHAGGLLLIDAGVQAMGTSVVVPYLQAEGIEEIDAVVMTHPHADHIGGLVPVLEQIPVKRIYSNYQVHTTQLYERLLLLIESLDIPFLLAEPGVKIEIPGIDSIQVLHPSQPLGSDLNNNSIVVRMDVDGVGFLFTGDIEKTAEAQLLKEQADLTADIIKVPHHGSNTSSHQEFIDAVGPKIAVIQVKEGNSYDHPDAVVVQRYQAAGAEVYRTDYHGTITVNVSNGRVSVETGTIRINLTTASAEQLQQVPGIGKVLADRIIAYRTLYGFNSVDDLINITGIGQKTLEKIREYFYVD
ncbi:MAG TPA: MBL fold metallo-hydrolase [Firmicutes bacterium]|nr:MBL fold metallo-hydrolase [Bacillota bacterium]